MASYLSWRASARSWAGMVCKGSEAILQRMQIQKVRADFALVSYLDGMPSGLLSARKPPEAIPKGMLIERGQGRIGYSKLFVLEGFSSVLGRHGSKGLRSDPKRNAHPKDQGRLGFSKLFG